MARKRSRDYWKNRALEVERQVFRKSLNFTQETLQNYEKALYKLEKDMNYWLVRLAENNNISLEEARKLLTAKELKEFKWTVEEYIKAGEENAINSRWMKELENASARVHISRLDAMRLQLRQQVELLTGKQNKALGEHLKDIYSDTLNRSLFEIQKGRGIGSTFAKFSQSELDEVIKKPWTLDKSTFSDRIWHHKEKLIDKLNTTLTRSIATGEDPTVAIEEIAKTFNRSRYEASRLVMTESAAFAAQADFDSYIKLGVKKYEIIATLDSKTSDICQTMDGKIFDVKDFQRGVTANPFHPNCRTTTAPYDEELEEFFGPGERAARDPRTGKTVMIPGDMTYAEWKVKEGKVFDSSLNKGYNKSKNNALSQEGSFATIPKDMEGNFDDFRELSLTKEERQAFNHLREKSLESGNEEGYILTPSGKVIEFKGSDRDKIIMSMKDIEENGLKLYHSHTNDTPFSSIDLNRLLDQKVSEVGVITRNGDVFRAYVGDGWIPTQEEFDDALKQIYREVNIDIIEQSYFNEWSIEEVNYMAIREQAYRITRKFEWTMEGGKLNDE